MNPVVHFELPYENRDRAAEFYTKAFGWKNSKLGPDMGDYVTVQTAETDENRMLKEPGRINGGMFKKSADHPNPSVVIAVDDINAAMQKIKDAGGTVVGGNKKDGTPDMIPGIGLYASFIDSEGNMLSILEPKGM